VTDYVPSITRDGQFSPLVLGKLAETFPLRTENQTTLPVYAGARTHRWESPTYYAEATALTSFREIIARGLRGENLELVCIGDSKTEGSGLTGAQAGVVGRWAWPSQLRRMVGASTGLIVANVAAGDNRWAVVNMTRSTASRCAVVPVTPGTPAQTKSAQLTTTEAHTGARIYAQSAAGATLTVTIDGAASSWVLPAATGWSERVVTGLANTTHMIKVESTGDFDLMGVALDYPTPRLKITRAGRASSTATDWNATTADGLWASTVSGAATHPDTLILHLGTNDPTNTAAITAVYARAAALNIPVLCVSPGGLGGLSAYSTYDAAKGAIYSAADANGFPLIDFEKVIGDYTTANAAGLMGDTVHENANGYALEATAMARLINLS